jgi:hypothetical protein
MKRLFFFVATTAAQMAAMAQQNIHLEVSNPLKTDRHDQPVVLSLSAYGDVRSALVTCNGQEVPCQLDDTNQDDTFDELCFLANLKSKEHKHYMVTLYNEGVPRSYPARVYAEMLMRNDKIKEKNRHDNFIESITARGDCANSYNLQHHHGVDFESEFNGIRIYFDKRQTIDLYGKFQKRLELQETQFYTTAEQKQQGYGDDVLWVGNTFGLGAFRGWDGKEPTMIEPVRSRTQRIISYGPLRTIVELVDRGWQLPATKAHPISINMTIRYTQYAGHRDTNVDVFFNKDVSKQLFSTGIINVKGSEEFSDYTGLRACWGTDYPSTDTIKWKRETVGLGIYIPQKYIRSEEPANKDNYPFVISTDNARISYKIIYCSDNETFGYHSAKEWFEHLKVWRMDLDAPVEVRFQ